MSKTIYVRIARRKEAQRFHRCGMMFTKQWQAVEVDAATEKRLKEEQMLEVSVDIPADLETDSPNAASPAAGSSNGDGTSSAPTDPAVRLEAIKDAVAKLDKSDAALFTNGGKPKTEALAAITGWPVTAAERDAAVAE